MKKIAALLICLVLVLVAAPLSVCASNIATVNIEGITLPIAGQKPDLTAQLSGSSQTHKITLVEWTEYDEGWEWQKEMTANDTFQEGYWYVVYVHLESTAGNTFNNDVAIYINNAKAQLNGNSVQANGTKVCGYVSYQATEAKTAIPSVALTVVRPVIGKTPTYAKVDTAQYFSEKYGTVSNCSNGVTWTNQSNGINITISNPFKENTKYKVTYYLTAKDGYAFNANTICTINGASASMTLTDATHITVSLADMLPGDGKREITLLTLSIPSPKDGAKPDYTKIDATGYYSDNGMWGSSTKIYKNGIAYYKSASSYISPGSTETFTGGTAYILKISLTPKDGYKFGQTLSATINGKTATVETFEDGSVTLTATLTALAKDHQHTESGWQTDSAAHWKICTDTACGAITTAKSTHADANQDRICDICGYVAPAEADPLPETSTEIEDVIMEDPTDIEVPEDNGETTGGQWIVWGIIVSVIVLGAGAAVVVILLLRKKKTNKPENKEEE